MQKPCKITEHVYLVGGSDISHPYDCNIYLVDAGDLVLIDAGAGRSGGRIAANIESLGFNPSKLGTVLVTHCHIDHVGGLAGLKKSFGSTIIAHELDAEAIETGEGVLAEFYGVDYQPVSVDREIQGEEEVLCFGDLRLKAVHVPGHTPGSIALLMSEPKGKKVLFGQDIHGPYNPAWGADPRQAQTSLEKLMSLGADVLCEGHFGVFQPADEVKKFIGRYLQDLEF